MGKKIESVSEIYDLLSSLLLPFPTPVGSFQFVVSQVDRCLETIPTNGSLHPSKQTNIHFGQGCALVLESFYLTWSLGRVRAQKSAKDTNHLQIQLEQRFSEDKYTRIPFLTQSFFGLFCRGSF